MDDVNSVGEKIQDNFSAERLGFEILFEKQCLGKEQDGSSARSPEQRFSFTLREVQAVRNHNFMVRR